MKLALIPLLFSTSIGLAKELPSAITVTPGAVNAITVSAGNVYLAINNAGDRKAEAVLLTHGRRDIVRSAKHSNDSRFLAGPRTVAYISESPQFWQDWWEARFDYYKQQVTQRPLTALENLKPFPDEGLPWHGLTIQALETPGYTVDGTTFLVDIEDKKIAFCGDLLLAGGKVRDLFSFQNEIREAKIGGYHGHLGRLHVWLRSLEKLAAEKPDILIPSRGPASFDALGDINRAAQTARSIYRKYLETNALHWYFGEERMGKCAELVLGENHGVKGMPLAEHIDLPVWCQHIGTTKLLVSESGSGFVLDVGGTNPLTTLQKAVADRLVTRIEGIFATHTHNDHTAAIADAAAEFQCPVYALTEVAEVLENPGNWFLPGVSANAVPKVQVMKDGETMKWEEFDFTFRFYPGQMYNHGALLVEKADHDPVFFIGDSFSPSGIDDYCLMNRNLMRDDTGYALCFRIIEELPKTTWLVNQHIPHLFRFSDSEREFLKSRYQERKELIAGFVAANDPNFGIDERWASFYPYGQKLESAREIRTEVILWNHSRDEHKYTVSLRGATDFDTAPRSIRIPARKTGSIRLTLPMPAGFKPGINVITADIKRDDGYEVLGFCETILCIE